MLNRNEKYLVRLAILSMLEAELDEEPTHGLWHLATTILDTFWFDEKITLAQKQKYDDLIDSFANVRIKIFSFKGAKF